MMQFFNSLHQNFIASFLRKAHASILVPDENPAVLQRKYCISDPINMGTVSKYTLTSPYVCGGVINTINLNQKHKGTQRVIYSSRFRAGICGRDCSWLWDYALSLWCPAEEQSVFYIAFVVQHLNISIIIPRAFLNLRNSYCIRVSSLWFSSRKNNLTWLNCKY